MGMALAYQTVSPAATGVARRYAWGADGAASA